MSAVLALTMTVGAPGGTADDCDHATLLGIVRRALENSPEFVERYGGELVGLVVPQTMNGNSDSYRSGFRLPTAVRA